MPSFCAACRRTVHKDLLDREWVDGRTRIGIVYDFEGSGTYRFVHNRPCPPVPGMLETVRVADLVVGDKVTAGPDGLLDRIYTVHSIEPATPERVRFNLWHGDTLTPRYDREVKRYSHAWRKFEDGWEPGR